MSNALAILVGIQVVIGGILFFMWYIWAMLELFLVPFYGYTALFWLNEHPEWLGWTQAGMAATWILPALVLVIVTIAQKRTKPVERNHSFKL